MDDDDVGYTEVERSKITNAYVMDTIGVLIWLVLTIFSVVAFLSGMASLLMSLVLAICGFMLGLAIRTIRPTTRGVVERLGKYNRFCEAGVCVIVPIVERLVKVNITEIMVNAEPQTIITKDKLNASVDAQVYFKVKQTEGDVKASQYNVYDCEYQIVNLARTTLRNIIGTMTLNEANSERDRINKQLMETLAKETSNWGIAVVRTELKEIDPPTEVQHAMNTVVIAENTKQAAIDFATAEVNKADGVKRAKIQVATGEAEAIKITASAQAEAIKLVNEAAEKYFKGNAQLLKALEVTRDSLINNAKVVLTEKGISPVIVLGGDLASKIIPIVQNSSSGAVKTPTK